MVQVSLFKLTTALSILLPLVSAHPGHGGIDHELARRAAFLRRNPSSLDHCSEKLARRGIAKRSMNRRMNKIKELRAKVGLINSKRSLDARQTASTVASSTVSGSMPSGSPPSDGGSGNVTTGGADQGGSISDFGASVANTSHLSALSVTQNTTDLSSIIFGNHSCVLNPEGETGPYYVSGEYNRSDIAESQSGVSLYLDAQFIDINTCEPIVGLWADIWHCNATGVYAGVVANGNGDSSDASNINATFLRGIQETDEDGVVGWYSIFPGYYSGRATHIHTITHLDATLLSNNTISGGSIPHIGQLFFDQSLIDDINANVSPYTENTNTITENAEDRVFITETATDSDPVVDYVYLGDDIEDGLFAWISIGVDTGSSYTTEAASVLTEDGGVATGNTDMV